MDKDERIKIRKLEFESLLAALEEEFKDNEYGEKGDPVYLGYLNIWELDERWELKLEKVEKDAEKDDNKEEEDANP